MKSILIYLSALFIVTGQALKAIPLEKVFVETQVGSFPKMKAFGKKLFVVTPYAGNSSSRPNYLYQYDVSSDNWILLLDGSQFSLNDFDIDLNGNLWVAADEGLYKYNWKNWQKFSVNDSLGDFRKYRRICVDSSDNIWVQTSSYIFYSTDPNHVKASYTEVFKFDGVSFNTMEFKGPGGLFDMITDEGFISAFGKVFIHLGSKSKEMIIWENMTRTVIPLKSIHSDNQISEICISQIVPDSKDNLWFANSQLSNYSDPGVSIFKNNGNWDIFTSLSNGIYNWRYSQELADSTMVRCNSIYEDKNGRVWIGGQRFFGYFNESLKLSNPSDDFFDNCILYSWKGTTEYAGTDTSRSKFLNILLHYYESLKIPEAAVAEVTHITGTIDGSLWFAIPSFGILRYNPNGFNSVHSEPYYQTDVMIYPQPVPKGNGYINLSLSEEFQTCYLKLYSALGNLILEKRIETPSRLVQISLPKGIAPGCYFAKISVNGKLYNRKILITD